jgi:hypothetical protein
MQIHLIRIGLMIAMLPSILLGACSSEAAQNPIQTENEPTIAGQWLQIYESTTFDPNVACENGFYAEVHTKPDSSAMNAIKQKMTALTCSDTCAYPAMNRKFEMNTPNCKAAWQGPSPSPYAQTNIIGERSLGHGDWSFTFLTRTIGKTVLMPSPIQTAVVHLEEGPTLMTNPVGIYVVSLTFPNRGHR